MPFTMYRWMLYFLLFLFGLTVFWGLTNMLVFNPADIFLTGVFLSGICHLSNHLLSKVCGAKVNLESAFITALILTLIVGPVPFSPNVWFLAILGTSAMASKYLLALKRKHIFNPVAIAVFLAAVVFGQAASWWIGSIFTFPFIVFGGFLVLLKIKRFALVLSFLAVFFLTTVLNQGLSAASLLASPVWFFVFVMLVEPLTSPSTSRQQVAFGAIVAFAFFVIPKIFPSFSYGLETSLLVGNLFSFFASRGFNVILVLRKKEKIAKDIWAFSFEPMSRFRFTPGQFLEWTYPHNNPDSRGVRRYFTVSSSPNEKYVVLTTRVFQKSSSFKKALVNMEAGEQIVASNPQGEFVLPKDKNTPLCFIAGGIGITPFRSMIVYLLQKNEKIDIVLLYSNNTGGDVVFKEIFEKAEKVGVKTVYIITEKDGYMNPSPLQAAGYPAPERCGTSSFVRSSPQQSCEVFSHKINEEMIKSKIPDYKSRAFYVSGPEPMVEAFKKMLSGLKIKNIKTDLFPGYP